MDSTMVYELIQQQLHNQKELLNLIPTLANLIAPHSRFSTQRMNDQQIFAQVYGCVRQVLEQKKQQREALLSNVQGDVDQDEVQDEQEQQLNENEEQQIDEQQIERDDEAEGDMIEEQENEDDEQLQDGQQEQEGEDDEDDFLNNEQVYGEGEDDVGLYGQQIDEEEMESYQNQGDSQEDRQFEEQQRHLTKRGKRNKQEQVQDEGDDLINDQFDHFRQIQLQNKAEDETNNQQKTDLQKQIQKLESKIISKKDWMLQGEVKATQRPVNSLLEHDLQFKTGIRLGQEVTPQQNEQMEKMIKQRILDELYDDRVRYQPTEALREQFGSLKAVSTEKSKQGLAELYESDFKNYLGLGQNKQDKLRAEILDAFKQVNYYLDSLSNFHFTPRPVSKLKGEAVIVEQRVPTAHWKGGQSDAPEIQTKFESQKEENKKQKRLKNKRIARQRKKQSDRKKLNKKIEYGGMTKFEAKAIMKTKKNNLNTTNVKYNKSANFFGEMNKDKSKKPNPNISKLKV